MTEEEVKKWKIVLNEEITQRCNDKFKIEVTVNMNMMQKILEINSKLVVCIKGSDNRDILKEIVQGNKTCMSL